MADMYGFDSLTRRKIPSVGNIVLYRIGAWQIHTVFIVNIEMCLRVLKLLRGSPRAVEVGGGGTRRHVTATAIRLR